MNLLTPLTRLTIWAPDAIPGTDGRIGRDLKRYVLPLVDSILIIMGLVAIKDGMPSFDLLYNEFVSTVCAWALLAGASAAFAGIVFPQLWLSEALGTLAIFAVSVGYSAALWVLYFRGESARGFVAGALAVVALVCLWNLIRLGREHRARHAAEVLAAARAAVAAREAAA